MTPTRDPEHELTIAWLQPDGSGGALDEQRRVVSIPGALPGDTVRYRELRSDKRRVHGELLDIVSPSTDRRTATCPHQATCGGCDLAELDPTVRREQLARMVQRALRLEAPPEVIAPTEAEGHRSRVKLRVDGTLLGYHGARSHALVDIDRCQIAHPVLQQAMTRLRSWLQQWPQPEGEIELRTDGHKAVFVFLGKGALPGPSRAAAAELGDVALGGRTLHGDARLTLTVDAHPLRTSPKAFFQVNERANELLVQHVKEQVLAAHPERVLDMYSGIGNLSVPLAAEGIPVVAVEMPGQSISDQQITAEALDLPHLKAVAKAAERFDLSMEPFDVAIVDPPRAGTGKVLGHVLRNRPRRLVYVSCHVLSAARELRPFVGKGWEISQVRCYDLFPDSHHIETVITLDRA